MALNYNNVQLGGRLTAKPELKKTANGLSVCTFTIAVNRKANRDETDFINCIAWRTTAEFVTKHFDKGAAIFVSGALQVRPWEDSKGNKRTSTEVIVDNAYFVEGKQAAPTTAVAVTEIEVDEDDMPF